MERMNELYEWLTTWDRFVSKEDRKRQLEETKLSSPRRRLKIHRGRSCSDPNATSSASEGNTSGE